MTLRFAVLFLVGLLSAVSIYQLSFTVVVRRVEKWAEEQAYHRFAHLLNETVVQEQTGGDPVRRLHYVDSVHQLIRQYKTRILDSLRHEVVYDLGIVEYTYLECKEREINLGLDLKGGVSVLLQVDIPMLIRELAGTRVDAIFEQAFQKVAPRFYRGEISDFPSALRTELERMDPDIRLARYFASAETQPYLTLTSTNDEVVEYLQEEVDQAVERTYNILRMRIDRFGVAQPFITLDPIRKRILLELPGVDDPYRVRKVIQTTARLEFWEAWMSQEIFPYLQEAAEEIDRIISVSQVPSERVNVQEATDTADTAGAEPELEELLEKMGEAVATTGSDGEEGPEIGQPSRFFQYFIPVEASHSPLLGYVRGQDTSRVMRLLRHPEVQKMFPPGTVFAWSARPVVEEEDLFGLYALRSRTVPPEPVLTGEVVVDARVDFDPVLGQVQVLLTMNQEGARLWRAITRENVGRPIAIVLDGKVYSAPIVQQEIGGGRSQITGDFTVKEAQDLAMILETGRLPARVQIIQEGVVGATLGKEAIRRGVEAIVGGFLLVMALIVVYYRVSGVLTVIALLLNLFLITGILTSLGATITLPGLAGLVLTVGMAVDANIIIFERIKEELLQEGKGFWLAVRDGFRNSRFAILDANVTTLIAGVILLWIGIGPIQGFATVLVTGIFTTLLVGVLLVYVVVMRWVERKRERWLQFGSLRITRQFTERIIPFLQWRRRAYLISGVLLLASLVSMVTIGFRMGVEFTGGYDVVVRFPERVSVEEIRRLLQKHMPGSFVVRSYGAPNQVKITAQAPEEAGNLRGSESLQTPGGDPDSLLVVAMYQALQPVLERQAGVPVDLATFRKTYVVNFMKIGPAFARDIRRSAIWSAIIGLLLMFFYIAVRFRRWEFGLGATLALFHDVLLVLGVYSLLHPVLPVPLEVNQIFIGAILTIIGYSINDTVVVFDRVREMMQMHLPARWKGVVSEEQFARILNRGVTTTLSRTLGTSITTAVVLIALLIWGSEVIQAFALALLAGVIVGTYSSVFVAVPTAYELLRRFLRK